MAGSLCKSVNFNRKIHGIVSRSTSRVVIKQLSQSRLAGRNG